MKKHGKLVRDKIPERIEGNGGVCTWHTAVSDAEFRRLLGEKLLEEVDEFRLERTYEELADVMEVIEAIIAFDKLDRNVLLEGYATVQAFTAEEFEDKDLEFDLIAVLDEFSMEFVARPTSGSLTNLVRRLWEVAGFQGMDRDVVETTRLAKRESHGAFEERIILDES